MNTFKKHESSAPVGGSQQFLVEPRNLNLQLLLLLINFWVLSAFSALAQDHFDFTTSEDGGSIITGYEGPGGHVVVPNELGGNPVKEIARRAFNRVENLTSISIPDSIITIGDFAFNDCENLTSISIPDSVITIGDFAFYGCKSLTSTSIPESVTSIGDRAFGGCHNLAGFNVDSANPSYSSFDGVLFDREQTTIIRYPAGKVASHYSIGGNVSSIGDDAFTNSPNLTSITMGDSVISIGEAAFRYCPNLTNITIGKNVTSISQFAFADCESLTNLTIGEGVVAIGRSAFSRCTNLRTVTTPDSLKTIDESAFAHCFWLTSIIFPDGLNSIGNEAFFGCINLQRIYFAGDAPMISNELVTHSEPTIYYLPGTSGWTEPFAGLTTILWNPRILATEEVLGFQEGGFLDGKFRFTISGAPDVPVIVEACDNLANPDWEPIASVTMYSNGTAVFSDLDAVDPTGRFYRFRPQ